MSTEAGEDGGGIGVGIDLGTTNSAISFLDGNVPRMISIPNNGNTMSSVVAYFGENGEDPAPLVGNDAVDWESTQNRSAYRHVKRIMGTGADYVPKETLDVVPYSIAIPMIEEPKKTKKKKKKPSLQKLLENAHDNPVMLSLLSTTNAERVSPEKISAVILDRLLSEARNQINQKISRAVIGVPAYFNDAQRDATVRAANLAGIDKVKLLREPEAAALAYGVDKGSDNEELVLVFDLGGGTYDVSILLVERGLTEIVCTSGDSQLGGSNFDARIANFLKGLLVGCGRSETASDSILRTAEAIRIYLSNNRSVKLALPLTDRDWSSQNSAGDVILPYAIDDFESRSKNSTHFFYEMTRKEMESLCLAELKMLLRPIREVAIMAGALLPGDTRPSIVESALEIDGAFSGEEAFYKENDELDDSSEAALDDAVPELDLTAAKKQQQRGRKKARQTAKKERKFREETKKANEVQPDAKIRGDGISGRPITRLVLVGGATRMPAIGRLLTALTGCPPVKTVDPDEAVALGCAVHVGVLDGNEEMGTVLNPMQAALLRAVIEKEKREGGLDDMFGDEDEFEFGESEDFTF